jgi:hypothetical protein
MSRPLVLVFSLVTLAALAGVAQARTLRHGVPTTCSVLSNHPCMPTFCSVFDRAPCVPEPQYGIGQDLHLTIESRNASDYTKPDHDLNTIGDLFTALRACWVPPPLSAEHEGVQMSIRFSFNRSGQFIASPRWTYTSAGVPDDARTTYRDSIDAAFARCLPLQFTKGLAGAIAGRPIAVRYVENRTPEGQKP